MKLVKWITDWNAKAVRTEGRQSNRCRDNVINNLRELKLGNWNQNVKDRKASKETVQKK